MENSIVHGDCMRVMKSMEDNSIDSIVTDPPYGLEFMGKAWDKGVPGVSFWQEMLRVIKPGGHLLSFGGSRTYHRMAVAIEDAGFEIRDQIMWVYGSGFPKSLNIGKAVDKLQGNERKDLGMRTDELARKPYKSMVNANTYARDEYTKNMLRGSQPVTKGTSEWEGWGTALKPAHEPIVVARKPLSEKTVAENVLKWGTGGLNIDGSRVGKEGGGQNGSNGSKDRTQWRMSKIEKSTEPTGRFPANFIHDGSGEVVGMFPETGQSKWGKDTGKGKDLFGVKGLGNQGNSDKYGNDSGSAARFFYTAKASKAERNRGLEGMEGKRKKVAVIQTKGAANDGEWEEGKQLSSTMANHHPTVKPISLMKYLIKLVTPPKGTVLDPFTGSGSTGVAAKELGYGFIGIEREAEYCEIARKRLAETQAPIL